MSDALDELRGAMAALPTPFDLVAIIDKFAAAHPGLHDISVIGVKCGNCGRLNTPDRLTINYEIPDCPCAKGAGDE